MAEVLTRSLVDGILLVGICNPPVNAISQAVRAGLIALARKPGPGVRAIALYGEGRCFMAGADIAEFAAGPKPPSLPDVCDALEGCAVPVVAALHGPTLGGGLEIALAAHARAALPGVALGLPEITLGLIPGGGGTQRLPRLVGVAAALEMILHGRPVGAVAALSLGLVDRIAAGTPQEAALDLARSVVAGTQSARRTAECALVPDPSALAIARLDAQNNPLDAFRAAVEAVAGSALPIDQGRAVELRLIRERVASDEHAALKYAFQIERLVRRIPEAAHPARPVATVAVLGTGEPARAIVAAFRLAGYGVVQDEQQAPQADLIVAAAGGNSAALFARLAPLCRPGVMLVATGAAPFSDQGDQPASWHKSHVGMHITNRLIEVIPGPVTAPDLVATAFAIALRLGKVAVRVQNRAGLIGQRVTAAAQGADPAQSERALTAMILEAVRVVEDQTALRPADVDAAMIFGHGFPRHWGGPMYCADRIGAAELVRKIESWAPQDRARWQVPRLLRERADTGQSFAALNRAQ